MESPHILMLRFVVVIRRQDVTTIIVIQHVVDIEEIMLVISETEYQSHNPNEDIESPDDRTAREVEIFAVLISRPDIFAGDCVPCKNGKANSGPDTE